MSGKQLLVWGVAAAMALSLHVCLLAEPHENEDAAPAVSSPTETVPDRFKVRYIVVRATPVAGSRVTPQEPIRLPQKLQEGEDRRSSTPRVRLMAPGKDPGALEFLALLKKLDPRFDYRALSRGEVPCTNGSSCTVNAGPEKGDPNSVTVVDQIRVQATAPRMVSLRSRGEVVLYEPATDGGRTRSSWSWNGTKDRLNVGEPLWMGSKSLEDGTTIAYVYAVVPADE